MTDEPDKLPAKTGKTANQTSFKPGYDPRRWLGGRGKKSPETKEGERILLAVIWEELSREFDTANMKPLESPETIDALRLMVRTWIKKKPEEIAQRIAGKVTDRVDVTTNGKDLSEIGVRLIDYRDGLTDAESRSSGDNKTPSKD
jgi:hypothetical protein